MPKNILMIGPTGCGKTEIARRLARLANAPFLKVEATKFTEVGYVGRDVESIVRDLVEVALKLTRDRLRREVRAQAEANAEERLLDALVGTSAGRETREAFRRRLRDGQLADREVEIEVQDTGGASLPTFDIPGVPGAQMGMVNLGEMLGKAFGPKQKRKKLTVAQALELLLAEEGDKLLDQERVNREALQAAEQNGIVFIDEIDKISAREGRVGADVSREGVQRDLLPLIEGTTVATKHGAVKTDHILFIASGAFHLSKPSDLLPELQGRLPIRVELQPLGRDDLARILVEPEASLIKQYVALLATEGVGARLRGRRDRGAGDAGARHQRPRREHRRPAAPDRAREAARGGELHRLRPRRRHGAGGRGLRAGEGRRPGRGGGPEPVHPVGGSPSASFRSAAAFGSNLARPAASACATPDLGRSLPPMRPAAGQPGASRPRRG